MKPEYRKIVDRFIAEAVPFRVYSYKDLGLDGGDPSVRSAVSRRKERIHNVGRGKFYVGPRPAEKPTGKLYERPADRRAAKRGRVRVDDLGKFRSRFHSVPGESSP